MQCFATTSIWPDVNWPMTTNGAPVKVVPMKATAKPAPVKWTGTGSLGLTATSGNVNSVLGTANLTAERKGKLNDLSLESDGSYGTVGSTKSAETLHGSAQDNYSVIDDTWYAYGRFEALHDAIADLRYRVTTSGGAGYYFIKDKVTTLSAEAGPALQVEQLDDEYHNYPSARVAETFQRKIDDKAKLWENVEVLPPLTDPGAVVINAEIGVQTPLTKTLSFQTYLDDNFNNAPAAGYKDNDLKLVSGIVIKF